MPKGDSRRTHGMSKHPLYKLWLVMRQRCRNPKNPSYAYYGGRGIDVCPRWDWFPNFASDVGNRPSPEHQLDRRDNNKDYSPDNCRWTTRVENMNNTRSNHYVEVGGQIMTAAELSRRTGIKYPTLIDRLNRGLTVEDAINWIRYAKRKQHG